MIKFSGKEYSIIYDAVRFYQMNRTMTGAKEYWNCDSILTKLEDYRTIDGIEPAYRFDT